MSKKGVDFDAFMAGAKPKKTGESKTKSKTDITPAHKSAEVKDKTDLDKPAKNLSDEAGDTRSDKPLEEKHAQKPSKKSVTVKETPKEETEEKKTAQVKRTKRDVRANDGSPAQDEGCFNQMSFQVPKLVIPKKEKLVTTYIKDGKAIYVATTNIGFATDYYLYKIGEDNKLAKVAQNENPLTFDTIVFDTKNRVR